jgi:hypothetical protein
MKSLMKMGPKTPAAAVRGQPAADPWDSVLPAPRRGRKVRIATEESDGDDDDEPEQSSEPRLLTGTGRGTGSTGTSSKNSAPDVGLSVQMEMLKVLKKMQKPRGSEDEGSDSEDDHNEKKSGLEPMHRMRRRILQKPRVIFKEYTEYVKDRFGVTTDKQAWHFRGFSRRRAGSEGCAACSSCT